MRKMEKEVEKVPQIDVIYTYSQKPQYNCQYLYVQSYFETKEIFVNFLIKDLPQDKLQKLKRISCQVFYCHDWVKLPKWYFACNGKFLFENGELIEELEIIK